MPAATICHRLGPRKRVAEVVSLPTGNTWAAECGLRNTLASPAPASPDFTIPATLTLIGVDPQNSTLNNYTLLLLLLLLAQDGPTTLTWANLITLSGTATLLLLAIKFYNKASAPTVGTDTPLYTSYLPKATARLIEFTYPVWFSTGIAYAITGAAADTDTTAVAANQITGILNYK